MEPEEEIAKASLSIKNKLKKHDLKQLFRHQFKLTILQYIISFIVLAIGLCFNYIFKNIRLSFGSITIKDVELQNFNINIGTVLIIMSIYMIMKITLNLNIFVNAGGEKDD